MAKSDRKTVDKVFVLLGIIATLVLVAMGLLALKASDFTKSSVTTQLTAQKIYFPPANSPAITSLPAADQKEMVKYAGQQLVNGNQAKVFANNFIAVHLNEVAGGQTYAQVSAKLLADPTNAVLKQQSQILFQGETLRGLLLGSAYGYWMLGVLAAYFALTALVGAIVMGLLVILGLKHMSRA